MTPAQLESTRRSQDRFGISFPFIEADAADVPLSAGSFDLAVSECGASLWCDPARWIPRGRQVAAARREAGVSHHHRPGHGVLPGLGRAGDGAVGAGFGDARLAAKSRTRTSGSWAMHDSARARLARKVQFATINMSRNSRNKLLVTGCERSVQGRYRNSAVNAANYPGLPQERTPPAWSSPSPWSWRSQCRVSG